MPSSVENLLAKQAGEFLVASEICRRGMFATTFSGNMPHYDILAHAADGRTTFVQVKAKTSRSKTWILDTQFFLDLEQLGETHTIRGRCNPPMVGLIFVFVDLHATGQADFYILTFAEIQAVVHEKYATWLAVKPRKINPSDVPPALLEPYRNRWTTITGLPTDG